MSALPCTLRRWTHPTDHEIHVEVAVEDDNFEGSDYICIEDGKNGCVLIHREHVDALVDLLAVAQITR